MIEAQGANALARETSPYLLQHAHNPVAWYPWGPEALERARREDRPILLSIGYSACHWCHVMAHESFEDAATASLMNELFVNVKVDREERPDLDKVYQSAHHLIARRPGGWPLTMFLDPRSHAPFFGGTYFPPESRHGLPGFREVLTRVAEYYRTHRDGLGEHEQALREALARMDGEPGAPATALSALPLAAARRQLEESYDARNGGFGRAPKFPHPSNLERLLRQHAASAAQGQADPEALGMVAHTLERMALGGIYDQVGGGFCRYSVDERWMIPHFEKMLYDNGPLLALYSEAWQVTRDPLFARVAAEVAGWVAREMQAPQGGYYSSLDADSQGEEGRYYLWTPEEVERLLEAGEYRVVARRFGLDQPANFEGRWHLQVQAGLTTLARELGDRPEALAERVAGALGKLLAARERRVRPGRDEKILTAWNGLMIRGMATAGRVFGEPAWVASAERAVDFLRSTLWRGGRLLATCKDGRGQLAGYLDDYAFLMDGLLALLQARWRDADLAFLLDLAGALVDAFEDRERGGFYFTARDHEALLHRPKPLADEALPAGNGVAARVLGRLGHLLGETRYLEAAERTLEAAWPSILAVPYAHASLLDALEEHLRPPQIVVLRGRDPALGAWQRRCNAAYAPWRLAFAIPEHASALPGPLATRAARGEVLAYVCEGFTCGPPVTTLEGLEAALGTAGQAPGRADGG
jgi:hypothetical protein